MLGVWPATSTAAADNEPLSVRLRVPMVIVMTILWVVLPQMYALYLVSDELPLAIDNFVTNCGSTTACAKYFFLWRNKRVLGPVIESLKRDWLREKPDYEREIMMKHAARARLFTVGGYWLLASCYLGSALLPLLGFNIRIINNITDYPIQHHQRHLLFQSYYPFDYWKSPMFELTELLQLFIGFFVGLSISMPDNYFGAVVFHVSGQFEILQRRLDRSTAISTPLTKDIVDRHVQLVKTVTVIERAFSNVILAQFLNMSLLICCIGFQLIGILGSVNDRPSYLPIITLIGLIAAFMMNTLLDCYASECLATTSSKLFHSIYNCEWYAVSSPRSTRNLFPMMMMMSMSPRRLTAGKIFQLSMAQYCSLLKSTGGYISMLLAISNR